MLHPSFKVRYYLCHDDVKRLHLMSMLKLYAQNRNLETLGHSLNMLLESDIERRLLGEIRSVAAIVLASSLS